MQISVEFLFSTEFKYTFIAKMLSFGTDAYLRFRKHCVSMRVYPKQRPSIKF